MSILVSLLLSQARVLPEIDRRALELQARAEALQNAAVHQIAAAPRRPAVTRTAVARTSDDAAPVHRTAPQPPPVRRTSVPAGAVIRADVARPFMPVLRRAAGGALDLSSITTICRAAGNQHDPATFIASLSHAYALSGNESSSLRTSCAAYLAGRADARVNSYELRPR